MTFQPDVHMRVECTYVAHLHIGEIGFICKYWKHMEIGMFLYSLIYDSNYIPGALALL